MMNRQTYCFAFWKVRLVSLFGFSTFIFFEATVIWLALQQIKLIRFYLNLQYVSAKCFNVCLCFSVNARVWLVKANGAFSGFEQLIAKVLCQNSSTNLRHTKDTWNDNLFHLFCYSWSHKETSLMANIWYSIFNKQSILVQNIIKPIHLPSPSSVCSHEYLLVALLLLHTTSCCSVQLLKLNQRSLLNHRANKAA